MTLAQGDKTAEYKDVLVNMEGYVLFVFLHFPKVPPLHIIPTDNGIKRDIRIYLRDRKVYNGGTLVTELLLCESPPISQKNQERRFSSENKPLSEKVLSTFFGEFGEKIKTIAFLFQRKGKYTNLSKKVEI